MTGHSFFHITPTAIFANRIYEYNIVSILPSSLLSFENATPNN